MYSAVPAFPNNFRFQQASMTSITLAWDSIPCLDHNSQVEEYVLVLTPPLGTGTVTAQVLTTLTEFTVSDLTPDTTYSIRFNISYTIDDNSPLSASLPLINASTFSIPGRTFYNIVIMWSFLCYLPLPIVMLQICVWWQFYPVVSQVDLHIDQLDQPAFVI